MSNSSNATQNAYKKHEYLINGRTAVVDATQNALTPFYISNNELTSLTTLPQNNKLTSLPTLPQNLEALSCKDVRVKSGKPLK